MYVCSASILRQTTDVFPDDIKLDVDNAAYADGVEIGVFERIGDDTHLEGVIRWRHTVRLTPLTVTLPLSTQKYPWRTASLLLSYLKVN